MLLCLRIWVYVHTGQNIYPITNLVYTPGYDHIWCFLSNKQICF